jgi:hypothetical protein
MGFRQGIATAYALHQLAHAHSSEVSGDPLLGQNARTIRDGA